MANYGTVHGADDYHASRGNSAWTDADDHLKLPALVRGSWYIDSRYRWRYPGGVFYASLFSGEKTGGRAQELEWPRTGATDYTGEALDPDVVPREVEFATYEAAVRELVSPGSLSPDFVSTSAVKKEKVGPVEVEYSFTTSDSCWPPNYPIIPTIDGLIAPVLIAGFLGPAVAVV